MNIGLINPNAQIKDPAIHLGLGYLASYAKKHLHNLNFTLLDTRVATKKERNNFLNSNFDLIGITSTSQVYQEALQIASQIKISNPNIPICLGGAHVSTLREEVMYNSPFDFLIYGEGELSFLELVKYLKGSGSLTNIHGLIYKDESGDIIKNTPRTIIKDIDDIPYPDYSLFKMNRYPHHRLTTSRGCPYTCVFCNSHSIWTHKWRKRTASNIIEEIVLLIEKYGKKTFVFNDDSFNIDLKRVNELCDLIINNKINILWSTSVRVDKINEYTALKMKQAGCYSVSIGIESANNKVLANMKKNITKEEIYNGIQIFRKANIDVTGQFMIGNPGDTLDTVKESISFAKESNLSGIEFYTALPYKDSYLWEYAERHGTFLCDKDCSIFHTIKPRIIFETPEFSFSERFEAIKLAEQNGYYGALSNDYKSLILDTGRNFVKLIQKLLGNKLGNKIYLLSRNFYNSKIKSK